MVATPRWGKRLLVFGLVLVGLAIGLEFAFRALAPRWGIAPERIAALRAWTCDGLAHGFEPRPHTVYGRPRNSPAEVLGTNAFGFRDGPWRRERTSGVPRVLCLGASTTEGGYPQVLRDELGRRLGKEVEVYNAGVAGWSTAETLIAWFLLLQDFDPDVVVLHHAANDVAPRRFPEFSPDYTHYRTPWTPPRSNALHRALVRASDLYAYLSQGRGIPVLAQVTTRGREIGLGIDRLTELAPEGRATFRRNLDSIGSRAAARGAAVCLLTMPARPASDEEPALFAVTRRGMDEHNELVRSLADEQGWLLVDAARDPGFQGEAGLARFTDMVHLDPDGRRHKAELVAAAVAPLLAE